ncbi:MAG: hypothetical protein GX902_00055, partial [Lentisphaerae bacterium]|nr:hypothetical protein [Lentisphaerota bacterium]
ANFAESKAGEWVVTINDGFTITGNDDGNYNLTPAADIKAKITPKPITVGFTAEDKEYDGTTVATVRDFAFSGLVGNDNLAMAAVTASFADSEPGTWLVTINDYTITGNDDDNYAIAFAADVEAEIRHNVQDIPVGWSMLVMRLDNLTAESVVAWADLSVMAFKDSTLQIQRGTPGYGESFWVFNRNQDVVSLHGLKRFDQPAWEPPFIDNAWIMTGPPAEDYVVPEGVQVWVWDGNAFILIPPGEKLPAGSAAWFWQ